MNGFEFNKIVASVLVALLISMVASLIADGLVAPHKLTQNAYEVVVVEAPTAGAPVVEVVEPIEPLLATASIENGQTIFKKCMQCHTAEKGGANKIGPHLWSVVGRPIGKVADFAYSNGMGAMTDTWTYAHLNTFLHNPRDFVKGTKMSFAGLSKAKDRADVIAYLRAQSDNPEPLPAQP